MKRRLSKTFTWISLLLGTPTLVLCIWSCFTWNIAIDSNRGLNEIAIYDGFLRVQVGKDGRPNTRTWNGYAKPITVHFVPYIGGYFHGPELLDMAPLTDEAWAKIKTWPELWIYGVNLWIVVALSAICPGILLFRHHARRRHRKRQLSGSCVECGYDLQATPDRCPECGTIAINGNG